MTKVNIKDLIVQIDINEFFEFYKNSEKIYIDIDGNFYNTKEGVKKPLIFVLEDFDFANNSDIKSQISKVFEVYKPEFIGTICKIKPLANWQNIIGLNQDLMLYFDHQSDGVEIFEDKILEDYGWHATSLEINYRQISEFIEENCEGFLLCYDNNVQFNGFVIIDDIDDVRKKVKEFIKVQALENIKNDLIDLEDDDVIEALELFGIEE